VNQKLVAEFGQALQRFASDREFGKSLPPVCDDHVIFASTATAQVQHQSIFANALNQLAQAIPIQSAFAKDPGSNDDMRCTRIEVALRVLEVDPTTDLQATIEPGANEIPLNLTSK
jgi:hypothetical protein